jgi:hypothetical protein
MKFSSFVHKSSIDIKKKIFCAKKEELKNSFKYSMNLFHIQKSECERNEKKVDRRRSTLTDKKKFANAFNFA